MLVNILEKVDIDKSSRTKKLQAQHESAKDKNF